MKKAPPPDPHRENFNNLGHGVSVYKCTEILFLHIVRTTEARRLSRFVRRTKLLGPLLPNRRLGLYVVV